MKNFATDYIISHPSFTTGEFSDALIVECPGMAKSTVAHYLKLFREEGLITRTGKGKYAVSDKKDYSYDLSDTAKEISALIRETYPLIEFQIWELYQMNEFVNHQISRNTIFVEVENMLDESVFDLLFRKYSHVLFKPDINDYYRYSGDVTIIVRRLISESPASYGEHKQASLEKILVDLFGRGISGSIISRSEYKTIYEDSFRKYNINRTRMRRYARRRGIEKTILEFIRNKTDIDLENDI